MKKLFIIISILTFPLFLFANPAVYEYSKNYSRQAFFNDNYRETWNKLSEFEQYAIAFSSNLFQLNNQYHLDFTGRTKLGNNSSDPVALLRDSWSITDEKSLIDTFNSLEEYGHSGAYKMLSDLLDKYPGKNPLYIAVEEKLDILDVTRLFFVRDSRDAAGIRGIEAWDEGREITIMRWGIASGYITEEKAKKLLKPVIERIKNDYSSWRDYSEHYWLGRQFYALYDCSQAKKSGEAIYSDYMARAYVPLDSIKFTGKNAVKEYRSALDFTESNDFLKWQRVQKLYNEEFTEEKIEELKKLEDEYSVYAPVFFWWHVVMLQQNGTEQELIDYIDQNKAYLDSLPQDGSVYSNTMYYYLYSLNNTFQPQKVLDILVTLPDYLQTNIYYYYQYAYANYLMLSCCTTQNEFDIYKERAAKAFTLLKENNYELNSMIDNWLKWVK